MKTLIKVLNWDLKTLPNSETYFEVLDIDILSEILQFKCPLQFEKFATKNIKLNKLKIVIFQDIEFTTYNLYELDFSKMTEAYIEHFEKIDDPSLNYPGGNIDKMIESVKANISI